MHIARLAAASRLAAAVVALTVASLAPGCSCGPIIPIFPELPDAGIPTEVPDGWVVIDEDSYETYAACAGGDMLGEEQLVAATTTLAAREDGTVDVSISARDCIRYAREIAGGQTVHAEVSAWTGEIMYVLLDGELVVLGRRAVLARWDRREDGALVGAIDADERPIDPEDDFFEVETISHGADYRSTRRDPASREPVSRLTIDTTGVQPTQTTERLHDGVLQVVDHTVITPEHERGGPSGGDDCVETASSCSADVTARLDQMMARAMARGATCLAGSSGDDLSPAFETLSHFWNDQHQWGCMEAGCNFAQWCGVTCPDPGANRIYVDVSALDRLPQAQQLGTLFHELTHGSIGVHTDVVVNSEIESGATRRDALMRRYVDRVDACEAYCFGDSPTRCACATCLDTRTCDPRCSELRTCVENDCTSGSGGCVPIMSEAIGAACVSARADGGEQATWFPTMAVCVMSGCGSGGRADECRSYSRSCNPGCE